MMGPVCTCPLQQCNYGGDFIHSVGCPVLAERNKSFPSQPPISGVPGREEARDTKQHGPYDRELGIFSALMRHKMENNRHRGRWKDCNLEDALKGIERELDELREAIDRGGVADILLEAADVANFALIAAFVAMENKNGQPVEERKKDQAPAARRDTVVSGTSGGTTRVMPG